MCHRQKTDKMAIPQLAELTWGVGMAEKLRKTAVPILRKTLCCYGNFFISFTFAYSPSSSKVISYLCLPSFDCV